VNSASKIAAVVADIRAGHVDNPSDADWESVKDLAPFCPVVDATAVYESIRSLDQWNPYADYPCIIPPWQEVFIGYENRHGNVIVVLGIDVSKQKWAPGWESKNKIEWDRVKWVFGSLVFMGGSSKNYGGAFPTTGPMILNQYAIYEDGTPADLHWQHLTPATSERNWDDTLLVVLGVLNFMNCRNVELVEPHRERAERRRIERTGVRVSTLHVFAAGKSSKGTQLNMPGEGVALTSVRGHFAKYGIDGRGLLFGKLSGRFWIPQHARGSLEHGEIQQQIEIHP
jgi:hypothetical protein